MGRFDQQVRFAWGHWAALCISGVGLISCTASQSASESTAVQSSQTPSLVAQDNQAPDIRQGQSDLRPETLQASASTQDNQAPKLIKTANLTLRVENVERSLEQVSEILSRQQGDMLSLDDQRPQGRGDRDGYLLTLRVPQANLTDSIKDLEKLGTIQRRSIKAQDVADQIVDAQARLKNLRQSEEVVLKIMDRSGSISDVLSASKELSSIRETIERIDAQLQSLKTRVAFSTINLRIESVGRSTQPPIGVGLQLQEAWKRSTSAMGNLTVGLLRLGIWGVAFSPYAIAVGLLIWLNQRSKSKVQN